MCGTCTEVPWLTPSLSEKETATPSQDGKSIGGAGRLTNSKIDKLQVYTMGKQSGTIHMTLNP